jgi:hypothetical protein
VLLAEQLERQVLADRQIAALQLVMAGEGGDLPTLPEAMQRFDEALTADPQPVGVDDDDMRLRRALGVS